MTLFMLPINADPTPIVISLLSIKVFTGSKISANFAVGVINCS